MAHCEELLLVRPLAHLVEHEGPLLHPIGLPNAQLLEGDDGYRRYVLVVEHDLAVLDYLSDYVSVLYGQAGGYGVVTMPFSVRVGINAFLAGYIPTENLRFRTDALSFKVSTKH